MKYADYDQKTIAALQDIKYYWTNKGIMTPEVKKEWELKLLSYFHKAESYDFSVLISGEVMHATNFSLEEYGQTPHWFSHPALAD